MAWKRDMCVPSFPTAGCVTWNKPLSLCASVSFFVNTGSVLPHRGPVTRNIYLKIHKVPSRGFGVLQELTNEQNFLPPAAPPGLLAAFSAGLCRPPGPGPLWASPPGPAHIPASGGYHAARGNFRPSQGEEPHKMPVWPLVCQKTYREARGTALWGPGGLAPPWGQNEVGGPGNKLEA